MSSSGTEPSPPPESPAQVGTPDSTVNEQIIDAVQASTQYAFGLNNTLTNPAVTGSRLSAGVAIAYDKVAQATSLAIQDATDYQRNVLAISGATQGKAMAMMLAGVNEKGAVAAFGMALIASIVAPFVAGEIGQIQIKTITDYPQG